jgi:hypothetical protein
MWYVVPVLLTSYASYFKLAVMGLVHYGEDGGGQTEVRTDRGADGQTEVRSDGRDHC